MRVFWDSATDTMASQSSPLMAHNKRNLYIVLGSVLGALLLALVVTIVLFCARRVRKMRLKRARVFRGRTVTPLDDAEFESWRRPSTYTQRPEKYTIRHSTSGTKRPGIYTDMPSPPPPVARQPQRSSSSFEKDMEMEMYDNPRPMSSPSIHTITSTRRPSTHLRRKSSVSIKDRPPTPFSSADSEEGEDLVPWLQSPKQSQSPRSSRKHLHYRSTSEASDFDFGFEMLGHNAETSSRQPGKRA